MQEIVIINQDSGYLMIDIANTFSDAGYDVTLIAGRLVQRNNPLAESIRFQKIIRYNRSNIVKRLFTWGVASLQILFLLWFRYRNHELLIVSNPPFAPLLPLLCKNKFSLLIYDVYPDALVELGYLSEKSMIIKFWKKANKMVYAKADKIFTLTNGMKQVLENYTSDKVINVVPIWTDSQFLKPVNQNENPFIRLHRLEGKFIVLYSGNIGLSGDVELIIDLAENLKEFESISFVIIGNGAKKEQIVKKAEELKLNNVKILPLQPVKELPFSLASANVAVVTLGSTASKLAVPSKLFNFLSVGSPLLCITSHDSEVALLVNKYNCGKSFEPLEIQEMTNYILDLADKKEICEMYKQNAIKASLDFTKNNVYQFIS